MKIQVHLGVHKTATTFIQSQLHDNRSLLSAKGVGFAAIRAVRKQFTVVFDRLSWIDAVWRPLTRPYLSKRLNGLLDQYRAGDTFILSDENLMGLISANYWTGRLYPRSGARVEILDSLLKQHDVHYFICIRRYPDYLTSSWLQLASRGKAPPFAKYRAKFSPASRGWQEIVGDVVKAVGADRLTVWTYDWFRDDPARAFTLLAPDIGFSVPEAELRRDILPSLTVKGLKVITQLEPFLSAAELKHMGRLMRTFPFEAPNPRLEIGDPALLEAYERKYQDDLARIRALGVTLHA
jgi:hypothetical protein